MRESPHPSYATEAAYIRNLPVRRLFHHQNNFRPEQAPEKLQTLLIFDIIISLLTVYLIIEMVV